jgi:hypothetical protein
MLMIKELEALRAVTIKPRATIRTDHGKGEGIRQNRYALEHDLERRHESGLSSFWLEGIRFSGVDGCCGC